MKILILGASGNLGNQLSKVYAKTKGIEVFGWDKNEVDITDGPKLLTKIIELNPGIIINAAAYNAVDKCEADEKEFALALKINSEAVSVMAETAEKIDAIFVHYSTDYVFDGRPAVASAKEGVNLEGYNETAEPKPINNYGRSKLSGEKEILSRPNLKYYLIRTSKLFGPLGPSETAKPSFFDIMLKVAKEKDEIKVVNEEKSCFTYTPDLAVATKKLIDDKKPFGIYHIINSGPATWYEACVELFKIIKNIPNVALQSRGGDCNEARKIMPGVALQSRDGDCNEARKIMPGVALQSRDGDCNEAKAGGDCGEANKKIIPVSGAEFPRPALRPNNSILLNTKLPPLRNYKEALQEYIKKITE